MGQHRSYSFPVDRQSSRGRPPDLRDTGIAGGEGSEILIADDDELFLESLARLLPDPHFARTCVRDSAEGIRLLSSKRYDSLIASLELPGNSQTLFAAEARGTVRDLPIIFVTSRPSVTTAMDAVRLKVDAYLTKPVDGGELLSCVRQSVTRSRLLRMVAEGQKRAQSWSKESELLHRLFSFPFKAPMAEPLQKLLQGSFETIVQSLADVRTAIVSLTKNSEAPSALELAVLSSRLNAVRLTLSDAVNVLEETKHAFKSKRLGELRQRLQAMLGKWDDV